MISPPDQLAESEHQHPRRGAKLLTIKSPFQGYHSFHTFTCIVQIYSDAISIKKIQIFQNKAIN